MMSRRPICRCIIALPALLWLLPALQMAVASCSEAAVRKAPYLIYGGVNTEMQVMWQLDNLGECTIEWGTDLSYSLGSAQTTEYGLDHQHSHVISDLDPGTIYYYRVTAGTEHYAGAFRAAPPGDAVEVKFVAYGDTRSYPAKHDSVAARIIAHCTADPDLQTLAISVGDLVYNGDLETDWNTQFFDPLYPNIRTLLASMPYQSAMGNHERTGAGFTKYFPYPFVAARYWSFDYGPAHFAVVDQYTPYGPGSDQLLWLDNDLASTAKPWRFVYLHEPGWSAGGGHSNETDVQTYIQPLCEAYCVAILFAGHNHYYARASVNGVEHITVGGGGAPLHVPNLGYPNVVTGTSAYSHCEIAIDGDSLTLMAFTYSDSLIDSLGMSLPRAGAQCPTWNEVGANLDISYASANPGLVGASVMCSIPVAGRAELSVYCTNGRKVATLMDRYVDQGFHPIMWDGRDQAGRGVAAGVYFVRLEAAGEAVTKKIVIAR